MKHKAKSKKHVVILGGGLAGLAAGYELARNGAQVTVIEKCEDVGGLARTIKVKDFSFDTGPHRWYTKSNMVNDWMLALLGDEVINVPRLTRIYFDRHFYYYPIKLVNALTGIGPIKAVRAIVDYTIARVSARLFSREMLTMEDGYVNQFGKTLYEVFFKRYSEKLWGEDCRNISIDWVGQRTRGLNILTIIKDTIFKSKNVVSLIDEFSYPKKGVGRIADKLAEYIQESGGKIYTNSEVLAINGKNNSVVSVSIRQGKTTKEVSGDEFITSIPLNETVQRMQPAVPDSILKLAGKLRYRDELQVALFLRKTHITPDTWIYVHPKSIPFMRVMEMDNWSDGMSPAGTTTMVFEIACNMGDAMWKKKDKEVVDLVATSFVQEFGLVSSDDIIGGYVHRVEKEYPVYHIGYRQDVAEIKTYISRYTNLQAVGRNGTFRYNNMDHSIEMGLFAAWNILKGKKAHDIDSVNIEREYLEEKRIETAEDEKVESPGITS